MFWYNDYTVLYREKHLIPQSSLSFEENLNVIVRLCFLLSLGCILLYRNIQYIFIFLISLVLTFVLHVNYKMNKDEYDKELHDRKGESKQEKEVKEEFEDYYEYKHSDRPTENNPFMNYNFITDTREKKPTYKAFLYENEYADNMKQDIEDKFETNLYRGVSDLYNKNNSQREFYSVPPPAQEDPGAQTRFGKWLFHWGPTAKELGLKNAPFWNPSSHYTHFYR